MKTEADESNAPWWTYGHVWLVIAGPAAVVVAALATAWIAMRSADPVLAEDYYRRGLQLSRPAPADKALMPALQGRNHAATPAKER
ncbi:FixH family protein [Caenimonas aquaedulcis]|uniref:FixH family protein n=1 Tax=Caenimonas aquaedulcis TaxID=2793270 RepID=A0A931H7Y7_9BURK|nr:FixH family protein [Caenimonas aquaedulcis]MBG9390193.1 FixH family protein [Caenimonas aquaedulcis]